MNFSCLYPPPSGSGSLLVEAVHALLEKYSGFRHSNSNNFVYLYCNLENMNKCLAEEKEWRWFDHTYFHKLDYFISIII